jgi:hypothetical protein
LTDRPDPSEYDRKPKRGGPRTAAGKAKVRLNAQKHQLFAKSGPSHHSSERVDELEADYREDVTSNEELGYLRSLAQVQAHINDIRRVRMAIWNKALQTAETNLDEMSNLSVFKPQTEDPIVRKLRQALDLPEEVPDPVQELVPERIRSLALQQVSKQLLTLSGYEQRAQGRRRKLMCQIMRIRVDQKWKSA